MQVKPFVKAPTTLSIAASGDHRQGRHSRHDQRRPQLTKDGKALPGQWVWLAVVANGKGHAPVEAFN